MAGDHSGEEIEPAAAGSAMAMVAMGVGARELERAHEGVRWLLRMRRVLRLCFNREEARERSWYEAQLPCC